MVIRMIFTRLLLGLLLGILTSFSNQFGGERSGSAPSSCTGFAAAGSTPSSLTTGAKGKSREESAKLVFFNNVERDNDSAFRMLRNLIDSKSGWTFVAQTQGISVEKRFLAPGPFVAEADARAAGKHACVKSHGIVNAPPESVFRIFMDRSRVREYNEHVTDLSDVHFFADPKKHKDNFSKITYAYGPKYGPFKPRDFLSVVHFQRFSNGTYVILNRPAYVPEWGPKDNFVRATVLLAGNVIEPYGKSGQQSYVTQVAHVNPGGGADTPAVAWIINKLCAVGPPAFIRKLEKAAQKMPGRWSLGPALPQLPPRPQWLKNPKLAFTQLKEKIEGGRP